MMRRTRSENHEHQVTNVLQRAVLSGKDSWDGESSDKHWRWEGRRAFGMALGGATRRELFLSKPKGSSAC